jgi:hypothetical protein
MKRNIIIAILLGLCVFIYFRQQDKNYYDMINAVSGATPLAIAVDVPDNISLTVDGLVKQEYRFSASALSGFASNRIRTREFTADGSYLGAYSYAGIPVFNILEGIAPKKPADAAFNQPQDIVVVFTAASGRRAAFSFNEIIMADDSLPVTLAYHREQIMPTNDEVRDSYQKNRYTQNLSGLRLIAPREPDDARYLDNVVRITYTVFDMPDQLLPPRDKGRRCASDTIRCVDGTQVRPAACDGVERKIKARWAMIGHGHGYEKTVSVEGFDVRSFLEVNFKGAGAGDYFLFVACDGYRCLFSGKEIFSIDSGRSMMIADRIDGQKPAAGFQLVPAADFFADRSLWALSHVVRIHPPNSWETLLNIETKLH